MSDAPLPSNHRLAYLKARFADETMAWTRWHVEELINDIERLMKQRDEGWDAFYKLRKSVAEEKYPGMTGVVRAINEAAPRDETKAATTSGDHNG